MTVLAEEEELLVGNMASTYRGATIISGIRKLVSL
jgi:hypothetical protein